MTVPDPATAEHLLLEAAQLNPGPWVTHSRNVAQAAYLIAQHHPNLEPHRMHTLGLLHDIGRRYGPRGATHVIEGYDFLLGLGYADAARIALTHLFAPQDVRAGLGEWHGTPADYDRMKHLLETCEYTDEDRLFQLADCVGLPGGFCTVEERIIDVTLRLGWQEITPAKWQAQLGLKKYFDERCGVNIYGLLPGLCERLCGEHRIR